MTITKIINNQSVELVADPKIVNVATTGIYTDYVASMYMVPITWCSELYDSYRNDLITAYIETNFVDIAYDFLCEVDLPNNHIIEY